MKFLHPAQKKHHARNGARIPSALRRDKGKGLPKDPMKFLAKHHGRGR